MKLTATLLKTPVVDADGNVTREWARFFGSQQNATSGTVMSGDAEILSVLQPEVADVSQQFEDMLVMELMSATSNPDAVSGASNLLDVNVIPKVGTAGTLVESAVSDDGTTVTAASRNLECSGVRPEVRLDTASGTQPGRLSKVSDDNSIGLTLNLFYDGANFNLDDISKTGLYLRLYAGQVSIFNATAGANPRTLTTIYTIDSSGNLNIPGVYKVGGTQVVGPQKSAISAPSGGGTNISAPSGGSVVDVQARTVIGFILAAISNTGSTVDPQARAAIQSILNLVSLAAGGHGLTA